MSVFGKRLQRIRIENDKTLDDIHEDTGIAKSTLSRYENDNSKPKTSILIELAKYFDVSIDYFLGLSDEKHPDNHQKDEEYKKVIRQAKNKGLTAQELETVIEIYPQIKQIIDSLEKQ